MASDCTITPLPIPVSNFFNAAILRVGYQRHEAALDTARLKVRDYRRFYQNLYGGGFENVNKKIHHLSNFV